MRAARLIDWGRIEVQTVDPRPPDEGEVVVDMALASICGSDVHLVDEGRGDPRLPGPPGFPGHEGVGVVVETRSRELRVGDAVLTVPRAHPARPGEVPRLPACFAEQQTLAAASCIALPTLPTLPTDPVGQADRSLGRLLLAQQLGTVVAGFERIPVDPEGRTVCVLGQGSAGIFFTALARRAGAATVVVVDVVRSRLDLARAYGADVTVEAAADDVVVRVLDATGGRGADVVIEAVGRTATAATAVAVAAPGAGVLFYGTPETPAPVPFDFAGFFRKRLVATSSYGAQLQPGLPSFRTAIDLIATGAIDVEPFTRHRVPLERIADGFELARSRPPGVFKVTITMEDRP